MKENILLYAYVYHSFILSSGLIWRFPLPAISTAVKFRLSVSDPEQIREFRVKPNSLKKKIPTYRPGSSGLPPFKIISKCFIYRAR